MSGLSIGRRIGPSGLTAANKVGTVDWSRLFDENSDSPNSHVLQIFDHGMLVHASGLTGDDKICFEIIAGCGAGDDFIPLSLGCCDDYCLSACRTALLIPFPGRVRAVYSGSRLGLFKAYASIVPVEHFPAMRAWAEAQKPDTCGCDDEPAVGLLECA